MKLLKNNWIKRSVIIFLLVVAGVSIGVVIQDKQADAANLQKQQELRQLYQQGSSATTQTPASGGVSGSSGVSGISGVSDPSSGPTAPETAPQFAELLKINPDLVGWLEVGELSTPVVQGKDNSHYLTRDFYGKEDKHGTVFADTRNDVALGDDNMILYGHNYNKSKQIFYEVERYKDPEYVRTHPVISFTTPTEKREYLVFGLFISNTEPSQGEVFDYNNQLLFTTQEEMDSFIGEVKNRSLMTTNLPVDSYDQLITLSTCGYEFAGERIVLVARRLRGAAEKESLTGLTYGVNPQPLMPESWTKLYGAK